MQEDTTMAFTTANQVAREDALRAEQEAGQNLRREIEDAIKARKFYEPFNVYGTHSAALLAAVKAELEAAGFYATLEQCGEGTRGRPWAEVTLRPGQ
jgi:hypothetical protein